MQIIECKNNTQLGLVEKPKIPENTGYKNDSFNLNDTKIIDLETN